MVVMESYDTLIPRSNPPDQNCFHQYRNVTGKVLHLIPQHEYMRRQPFLFYRDTIRDTRERIESIGNRPLFEVMQTYHSGYFSEFNLFATYAFYKQKDHYSFVDVWNAPELIVRQFHSYSQKPTDVDIDEEVKRYLA